MSSFDIQIKENNIDKVKLILNNAIDRGLKVCGEKAVGYAVSKVRRDTSNLANSITYQVNQNSDTEWECVIGTDVEYGIYNEYGTGIYAENGGGRKTSWVYEDANGEWHRTNGMTPQPFIRPAVSDHKDEYMDILKSSLKNA